MGDSPRHRIGLLAGAAGAIIILLFFDLQPGNPVVTRTAAVAFLMAVWWITEAIPIPATALLPIALFPLLGIMSGEAVAAMYFNNVIFLFIGGFIMALAMEKWNLHRRIALRIILLIGVSPKRMVLGFMAATFFMSMWISNTAAAMMVIPMAMAINAKLKETFGKERMSLFSAGLLIGIAYAASIGGIATLIGTPPNLAFLRIFKITFPNAPEITFADWFVFAMPFAAVFLIAAWGLLTLLFVPRKQAFVADKSLFKQEYQRLGKISFEEKMVLTLFVLMAILWMFRGDIHLGDFVIPGWTSVMAAPDFIDDGTVAIAIATLLFLIPARAERKGRLMDWKTASKLHWGIVILFGGGFALAEGFSESGLSSWLGEQLTGLSGFSPVLLVAAVCTILTFLTELTSNTATTQMILPILASLSVAVKVHPLLLMIPATLSASCAFMLPVGTPPNAIVFGTGEVRMQDMMKSGIFLNLIGIIWITAFVYLLGTTVFHIDLAQFPDWALTK